MTGADINLSASSTTKLSTRSQVTLNGTSKAGDTASFYAPTSAGTNGQVLKSSGSGAPIWGDLPSTFPIGGATETILNETNSSGTSLKTLTITTAGWHKIFLSSGRGGKGGNGGYATSSAPGGFSKRVEQMELVGVLLVNSVL